MAPTLKLLLLRVIYPPGVNPLPLKVCIVTFVNLVLNSCTLTMAFPYLPKMMKTFGASEVDVGYYAGWIASSLFIARIISSTFWGLLVDKFGARAVGTVAALCLSVTTIMFGFSYNFYWALCTRFSQGLCMGFIVASKSLLYDVSDNTNQPYGMAIVTTAFTCGMILGPSLGGFLVLPAERYPEGSIFRKYLFLLPNLVVGLLIGACASSILLLPKARNLPEGVKLLGETSYSVNYQSTADGSLQTDKNGEKHSNVSELPVPKQVAHKKNKEKSLKDFVRLLKNKDVLMTCGLYLLYSLSSIGFDELFSVWAATNKAYNGLGFTPSQIGLQLLISCLLILVTFPIMSTRITNFFGCKKAMIYSSLILSFVTTLYPSTSRIENRTTLSIGVAALVYVNRVCASLCLTAVNIFQNNSVTRDQVGTVNGLGITFSAVGRSLSPILVGSIYSWSLKNVKGVNKDGLGFPFNNYLAFFYLSLCFLATGLCSAFIPDYLNFRKEEPEDTVDHKEEK